MAKPLNFLCIQNSPKIDHFATLQIMWYNKKFFRTCISIILILIIILLTTKILPLIYSSIQFVSLLIFPILLAAVLYYIFRPLCRFLEDKKVPKLLTILCAFLVLIGCISIVVSFIWPYISTQITEFAAFPKEKIQEMENQTIHIMDFFNFKALSQEELREKLIENLQIATNWITSYLVSNVSSIAKIASYFVITPFILFYFLKDDHKIYSEALQMAPKAYKERTKNVLNDIDQTLAGYITSQVLVAIIVGFLIFIGYSIIGLRYTFLLAIIATIFNLIPFCGPFISTIPALFIGLSISPWMALKVLAVVLLVHLLDLNIISPRIVGQRLHIHPVTVVFLIIVSLSFFGILGLFFIVPTYAVLKTFIVDMYTFHFLEKENN